MTQIIDAVMLWLSSSLAASILGKATVIATLGLVGAWLTRRRRAAVRHAVLAASFAALLALPIASTLLTPVRIALPASAEEFAPLFLFPASVDAAQGTASAGAAVTPSSGARWRSLSPYSVLLAIWAAGAAFFLMRMTLGLRQVRAVRRLGLPWRGGQAAVNQLALDAGIRRGVEVLLHESLPAPVTCGIARAAILLPSDAQEWEQEDLNRAIVHELEHVRRFDWATLCLARIACAAYWFHPLVWAARRQLALEAERSCDDAVLTRSEATAYADQLVGLARRLAVMPQALAMANRSDLSARVRSVLDGGRARGRAGVLLIAAACMSAGAIVLIMSPLRMVAAPQAAAQAAVQNVPKWDSVSVKRCTDPTAPPMEGRGPGSAQSPDRLFFGCLTLSQFAGVAYISWAGGRPAYNLTTRSDGFPDWASSEKYTIEAKAEGTPGQPMLRGPMLQALLEDRFKLRVHEQTREGKVYILSVAKSGPKMDAQEPGGCSAAVWGPAPSNPCTFLRPKDGTLNGFDAWMTMDSLASYLMADNRAADSPLDSPVLNQTGLTGAFHVHLFYAKRDIPSVQASDATSAPSIFTTIQQLGLKLEAGKGPRKYLVFDHAERPTEN